MEKKTYSMKKAVLINAGSKYTQVIVQLLLNIILARLLEPKAYGVVAVITVFVSFFNILADMGFGSAVIQDKTLSEEETSDIFSFTCYLSLLLSAVFAGLSCLVAVFYNNSVYSVIGRILAVSVMFNTLNMVPKAVLMKKKKFLAVAVRTVFSSAGAGAAAVILAYCGWGIYALVFQTVISSVIAFLWNVTTAKIKFKFRISLNSIKKVLGFSSYQFGFSIVNYFSRNLDNLLIGKVFGEFYLGIYSKSYQLMTYPINNLTSVVTPALQPILSDYQNDSEIIYEKSISVFSFLAVSGVFVSAFCCLAPEEIILILYGTKWTNAIPYFKILSLSIFAQMIYVSAPAVFLSLGDSKLLFQTSVKNTLLTVTGIFAGLIGGSMYILTIGVTIAYNIIAVHTFYVLVKRGFKHRPGRFWQDMKVHLMMYLILLLSIVVFPFHIKNIWIGVIVKGLYLGSIYIILLFVTGTYRIYFNLVKKTAAK